MGCVGRTRPWAFRCDGALKRVFPAAQRGAAIVEIERVRFSFRALHDFLDLPTTAGHHFLSPLARVIRTPLGEMPIYVTAVSLFPVRPTCNTRPIGPTNEEFI